MGDSSEPWVLITRERALYFYHVCQSVKDVAEFQTLFLHFVLLSQRSTRLVPIRIDIYPHSSQKTSLTNCNSSAANGVHLCQCVGRDKRPEWSKYSGRRCWGVDEGVVGLGSCSLEGYSVIPPITPTSCICKASISICT